MTIVQRDQVRAAVERALQLDPHDSDAAVEAAARSLALPVEAVREAMAPVNEEQAA